MSGEELMELFESNDVGGVRAVLEDLGFVAGGDPCKVIDEGGIRLVSSILMFASSYAERGELSDDMAQMLIGMTGAVVNYLRIAWAVVICSKVRVGRFNAVPFSVRYVFTNGLGGYDPDEIEKEIAGFDGDEFLNFIAFLAYKSDVACSEFGPEILWRVYDDKLISAPLLFSNMAGLLRLNAVFREQIVKIDTGRLSPGRLLQILKSIDALSKQS